MKRFLKLKRVGDDEKGFTLIELLIVVTLMGILAAVVVLNVVTFFQSAEKGAAESELGSVQVAVYAAMAEQGVDSTTTGYISSGGDTTGLNVGDYLQGELARLKGVWYVDATGLIDEGWCPTAVPRWHYDEDGSPQWEYQES